MCNIALNVTNKYKIKKADLLGGDGKRKEPKNKLINCLGNI